MARQTKKPTKRRTNKKRQQPQPTNQTSTHPFIKLILAIAFLFFGLGFYNESRNSPYQVNTTNTPLTNTVGN